LVLQRDRSPAPSPNDSRAFYRQLYGAIGVNSGGFVKPRRSIPIRLVMVGTINTVPGRGIGSI